MLDNVPHFASDLYNMLSFFCRSLSVRSTASSGYDSSESGSDAGKGGLGIQTGIGGTYDLSNQGPTSPILRRQHRDTRDQLVSCL